MTKKISQENLRVDDYLLVKFSQRQSTLLLPIWTKLQLKFNSRMQDVKRVLDLIASKRSIKQFNFFNWLSNFKNLALSNGSEHVRNVIQWH